METVLGETDGFFKIIKKNEDKEKKKGITTPTIPEIRF